MHLRIKQLGDQNEVLNDLNNKCKQLQIKECTEKRSHKSHNTKSNEINSNSNFKISAICAISPSKPNTYITKQCAATIQIENITVKVNNANSRPIQRNNANT